MSVLTGRKLKLGSYDERRKAWQPEGSEIPGGATAFILRKISGPDEVLAFELFDGTREELEARPEGDAEAARQVEMAPHSESQFADGLYEVVEIVSG